MENPLSGKNLLLWTLLAATFVYGVGHFTALTNPYVIDDDVRQQVYWMQQWRDPDKRPR